LVPGGNNRIIFATDGDFNVGVSSTVALERLIENKRRSGTSAASASPFLDMEW